MTRRSAKFSPDNRSAQELATAFLDHELIPAGGIDSSPSPSLKVRDALFSELAIDHEFRGIIQRNILDREDGSHSKAKMEKEADRLGDFAFGARQFMHHMHALAQHGTLKDHEKQVIGENGLLILSHLRTKYANVRSSSSPLSDTDRRQYAEMLGETAAMQMEKSKQDTCVYFSSAINNLDRLENLLRNIASKLNIQLTEPPAKGQGR